ncbi:MAG: DUF1588 domain-containing protein [Bryobacterales bacterium]|nr:DUF1588 domain-containing protein [Bryobacterales bacterium]
MIRANGALDRTCKHAASAPPQRCRRGGSGGMSKTWPVRERRPGTAKPACAGCHRLMDPPGFSLENYGAVAGGDPGRRRSGRRLRGGLPDGSEFEASTDWRNPPCRAAVLLPPSFTEKLLT